MWGFGVKWGVRLLAGEARLEVGLPQASSQAHHQLVGLYSPVRCEKDKAKQY